MATKKTNVKKPLVYSIWFNRNYINSVVSFTDENAKPVWAEYAFWYCCILKDNVVYWLFMSVQWKQRKIEMRIGAVDNDKSGAV